MLVDQRGCGRSTPHAADIHVDLRTNTTHHLLTDLELLRRHLAVERWLVFGGSWGSTLGLAYAERHPAHVTEIVLYAVATTRRHEVRWTHPRRRPAVSRGVGALPRRRTGGRAGR